MWGGGGCVNKIDIKNEKMWSPVCVAKQGSCEHGNEPSRFRKNGFIWPPSGQTRWHEIQFQTKSGPQNCVNYFSCSIKWTNKNFKNWLRKRNGNHTAFYEGGKPQTIIQVFYYRLIPNCWNVPQISVGRYSAPLYRETEWELNQRMERRLWNTTNARSGIRTGCLQRTLTEILIIELLRL